MPAAIHPPNWRLWVHSFIPNSSGYQSSWSIVPYLIQLLHFSHRTSLPPHRPGFLHHHDVSTFLLPAPDITILLTWAFPIQIRRRLRHSTNNRPGITAHTTSTVPPASNCAPRKCGRTQICAPTVVDRPAWKLSQPSPSPHTNSTNSTTNDSPSNSSAITALPNPTR